MVSVFAMRDIFVSMTELQKNLRTKRAAFSSGMPDVNSMEFDLLAGCGLLLPEESGVQLEVKDDVFSSFVNCVVLFGDAVLNRVTAVLDRLLNVVDVIDLTELLLRMMESLNSSIIRESFIYRCVEFAHQFFDARVVSHLGRFGWFMMDNANGWFDGVMFDSRGHHERLPPLLLRAGFTG